MKQKLQLDTDTNSNNEKKIENIQQPDISQVHPLLR